MRRSIRELHATFDVARRETDDAQREIALRQAFDDARESLPPDCFSEDELENGFPRQVAARDESGVLCVYCADGRDRRLEVCADFFPNPNFSWRRVGPELMAA